MNIPATLGGFQISERLGAGAMGTVYRAVQSSLGRVVVIKTLHPHLAADDDLIARFEREARHAAHLQHQNTVQVIEFGQEGEVHYIAMEYVEGMDLKQILQLRGPFPIPIAMLVLRDVCRGLEAAHARDIIHRDIKPANLMITKNGVIKVMDFGLARETAESSTLTAAGSVMGSPAYMSPEQARGAPVDQLTDVFSTGLVGYEILSGVRAFTGESYPLVLHRVLNEEIPPLASLRPDLPAELLELIEWMTRKDPAQRCPSISEARDQLEAMVKQLSLKREDAILGEFVRAALLEKELRDPRPSISEARSSARTVIATSDIAKEMTATSGSAHEGTVISTSGSAREGREVSQTGSGHEERTGSGRAPNGTVASKSEPGTDGTVVADPARTHAAASGAAVRGGDSAAKAAGDRRAADGRAADAGHAPESEATPQRAHLGDRAIHRTDASARSDAAGRSVPAAKQTRRWVALASLGLLALVAAGWFFMRPDSTTTQSADDPSTRSEQSGDVAQESGGRQTDRERATGELGAGDGTNLRRDSEDGSLDRDGAGNVDPDGRGADPDGRGSDPDGREGIAADPPDTDSNPGTDVAETDRGRTDGSRTVQQEQDPATDPGRNLGRDSDDTQEEQTRTVQPAGPFEQEYSISTFPGFAFIRVNGRLLNEDGNLPVRTVLREGTHTFQLTRSNGEDLGTLQYSVTRNDPNHVLILKFEERLVEARVK